MQHHPLYLTAALIAIILFAGNCRKSEHSLETGGTGAAISFSIAGRVLDKDNQPVAQARVTAGGVSANTDIDGYFRLNNVTAPRETAYVQVEKPGYFPGSRTFVATTSGALNFVSIRLIPKDNTGSFSAAAGGKVTLPGGSSITFQANGVTDASGNAYTGTVSVAAFFIDPTADGFRSIMPGDLRGINAAGQETGLQSFGMMAVELSTPGGQQLQLAAGKKATMRFQIPAAILSQAPATIPLWSFDQAKGLWKEEGSAAKQGNEYVGEVSHFSFWNCDYPFPLVNFQATIKDQNGAPIPHALVVIKKTGDGSSGAGYTDSSGVVCGKVPANQPLELKVYNRCGGVIFTQNIGPFSSNTNLGILTVNVPAQAVVTISGTAVDCGSGPVTNGYVNVYLEGMNYRTSISNGSFSLTITRCTNATVQAQVLAVDVAAGQQGATTTFNVSSGPLNTGQLTACGVSSTQFINYTLNATNFGFMSPPDSVMFFRNGTSTNMLTGNNFTGNQLMMQYEGTSTGAFTAKYIEILHGNKLYRSQTGTVNITQYGNVGDFILGNFSATVTDSTATYPVTGNFKALRVQ